MKVAALQMCSTQNLSANLDQAQALLLKAHSQGVELAVLPENFAYFGGQDLHRIASQELNDQGPISQFLAEQSRALGLWIVAGTMPRLEALNALGESNEPSSVKGLDTDREQKNAETQGSQLALNAQVKSACFEDNEQTMEVSRHAHRALNKVFACSSIWAPDGAKPASYNKCHLFDVEVGDEVGSYRESDQYRPGTYPVSVDIGAFRLGLSVCYDLRFPEFYRRLTEEGCNVLTVPSAFTYQTGKAHWEVLLRARAIENQSFVIAANQGGEHGKGRQTWGHSMIINGWGDIMACCDQPGPGLAVAQLTKEDLNQLRSKMPCLEHRKF